MSNGEFFFMGEPEKPQAPAAEWRAEYPGQAHLFLPGWTRSACGRKTPKGTALATNERRCSACEKSEATK